MESVSTTDSSDHSNPIYDMVRLDTFRNGNNNIFSILGFLKEDESPTGFIQRNQLHDVKNDRSNQAIFSHVFSGSNSPSDEFQIVWRRGPREFNRDKEKKNRLCNPTENVSFHFHYLVKDQIARDFLERYCIGGSGLVYLNDQVAYIRDIYNKTVDLVLTREKKDNKTFPVRNANNFIKSILFGRFIPRNKVHIELGCGRGQDMYKLQHAKPAYVILVDISERCLMEAEKRWKKNKYQFPATFIQDDFCSKSFLMDKDVIIYRENNKRRTGEPRSAVKGLIVHTGEAKNMADVISCQFSCHYAFFSPESAEIFIDNVVRILKPGGMFLGTAPQGEKIVEKLNMIRDGSTYDKGKFSLSLDIESLSQYELESKNETSIQSLEDPKCKKLVPLLEKKSGIPYFFSMKDTIACRQYTMTFGDLLTICSSKGLKLIYFNNLRVAYENEIMNLKNEGLMQRMKIADTPLDESDKDNMSMYCTFAFVKMKN